jgi:hypothetical protein
MLPWRMCVYTVKSYNKYTHDMFIAVIAVKKRILSNDNEMVYL